MCNILELSGLFVYLGGGGGGLVAWGTDELASGISTPADTMMFFKDASGNTKYATMALDN